MTELVKQFEKEHDCKIIYLVTAGSRLFGTDTPNSDVDYRGIFIPSKKDIILKRDIDHWDRTTGDNESKNGKDDVDFNLWSLHKFMRLLAKGETGALDLLFSMQRKDLIHISTDLSREIYKSRHDWLHKNAKAFVGFALSQARKYGVKGDRYKELLDFNKYLVRLTKLHNSTYSNPPIANKLSKAFNSLIYHIDTSNYKYIKMIRAPGPKGSNGHEIIDYLEILGKKFSGDVTLDYVLARSTHLESSVGNRTKAAIDGTDWKSLSHAIRVLGEITELLGLHTIRFPLENAMWIKGIKNGEYELDPLLEHIEEMIEYIDKLLITTTLPETINQEAVDKLLLKTYL